MELPSREVSFVDSPGNRALMTDTGKVFVAGITEKGPHDRAVRCRTMSEFEAAFGGRYTVDPTLHDALDRMFRVGIREAYVMRIVGAAPVRASVAVMDGAATPAIVWTVEANDVGLHGSDLNVVVRGSAQDAAIPAGSYRLRIQTDAGVVLAESGDLLDKAAGTAYLTNHPLIRIRTDGISTLDPAPGTYALAGGTDDIATVSDATRTTALNLAHRGLGVGQVAIPGVTSATGHAVIQSHGQANNRVPILDAPNSGVEGTLAASFAAAMAHAWATRSGIFFNWPRVGGTAPGTFRTLPPSATVLGLIARSDGVNPINTAPAGEGDGEFDAISMSHEFTEAQLQNLYRAGGNPLMPVYDGFQLIGFRSLAPAAQEQTWGQLNHARTAMKIQGLGERILDSFKTKTITPNLIGRLNARLVGMLLPLHQEGSLWGPDSPDDAFGVDTESVNTDASIEAGQLNGAIWARFSKHAEKVRLTISKRAIGG